jgi:hypothetical protein
MEYLSSLCVVVQPFIRALADIEIENLIEEGKFDEHEFDLQLQSIYYSQLYCPIAIEITGGMLVGAEQKVISLVE